MHHGERFNSITHFIGAVMALLGAIILILMATRLGDPWKIVSVSIYGASLLALYASSTLYHGSQGTLKSLMQKFDHCAIYLLIAGTYTPFMLVSLRTGWGWPMFALVWTLALIGIGQELLLKSKVRRLSLVLYVLMGWVSILTVTPLIAALGWQGFGWLIAGGILYTGGIAFYVNDHRIRHGHGVWHLFVLGGSTCHYVAVAFYVM
jgi:hemolysin III